MWTLLNIKALKDQPVLLVSPSGIKALCQLTHVTKPLSAVVGGRHLAGAEVSHGSCPGVQWFCELLSFALCHRSVAAAG
jgi:hypothetical protein